MAIRSDGFCGDDGGDGLRRMFRKAAKKTGPSGTLNCEMSGRNLQTLDKTQLDMEKMVISDTSGWGGFLFQASLLCPLWCWG